MQMSLKKVSGLDFRGVLNFVLLARRRFTQVFLPIRFVFLQEFKDIIVAFGLTEALLPPLERTIRVSESVRIMQNEMAMAFINAACGRFPDHLVVDCEPEAKFDYSAPPCVACVVCLEVFSFGYSQRDRVESCRC